MHERARHCVCYDPRASRAPAPPDLPPSLPQRGAGLRSADLAGILAAHPRLAAALRLPPGLPRPTPAPRWEEEEGDWPRRRRQCQCARPERSPPVAESASTRCASSTTAAAPASAAGPAHRPAAPPETMRLATARTAPPAPATPAGPRGGGWRQWAAAAVDTPGLRFLGGGGRPHGGGALPLPTYPGSLIRERFRRVSS
jgi:hypothetical protein